MAIAKKINFSTSMRLDKKLLTAADVRAAKLGLSRTQYFEQLLRADLKGKGFDGVDLDERADIFS